MEAVALGPGDDLKLVGPGRVIVFTTAAAVGDCAIGAGIEAVFILACLTLYRVEPYAWEGENLS